jgi:hypothetical protein
LHLSSATVLGSGLVLVLDGPESRTTTTMDEQLVAEWGEIEVK